MFAVSLTIESPFHPGVGRLLERADARAAALYPAESRHGLGATALAQSGARIFVAWADGQAVGCGGYVLMTAVPIWAEVKRLFVQETARGRGIARALMAKVEAGARTDGAALLRLETGVRSDEARSLYRDLGFEERGPFGGYAADPLSVFMEKRLD